MVFFDICILSIDKYPYENYFRDRVTVASIILQYFRGGLITCNSIGKSLEIVKRGKKNKKFYYIYTY